MELLDKSAVSYVMVLTKTDEMKGHEIEASVAATAAEARKHTPALAEIFPTSSLKNKGLEDLRTHIAGLRQQ